MATSTSKSKTSTKSAKQKASEASALASMNKIRTAQGLAPQTEIGVKAPSRMSESTTINSQNQVVGTKTGKTYASGSSVGEALAKQTQLSTGSAPNISGRPDLFAVAPNSNQKVENFFDKSVGQTITPTVATPDQLAQAGAGTLQSYNASKGLTYLDGATWNSLSGKVTEDDILRGPEGQIWLKNGLTVDDVLKRGTQEQKSLESQMEALDVTLPDELDSELFDEAFSDTATDSELNQLMAEQKDLQDQYLETLTKSDQELVLEDELTTLHDEINAYKESYTAGVDKVEDEVMPMSFITGEQASLERQYQRGMQNYNDQESNLLERLGLAQENRQMEQNVLGASINFAQQRFSNAMAIQAAVEAKQERIFNQAMTLKSDARSSLATIIDMMPGVDYDDMTAEQQNYMNQLATSSGIPSSLVMKGLEASKDEYLYNQTFAELKNKTLVTNPDGSHSIVDLATGKSTPVDETDTTGFTSWLSSVGNGTITQDYSTDHNGKTGWHAIDIDGKIGDLVTSPVSGTVTEAAFEEGWGNTVVIEDSNGNKWRMAHFDSTNITVGDTISSGQAIGILGNTGNVIPGEGGDGSHLHLQVQGASGGYVDPRSLMGSTKSSGNSDAKKMAQDIFDGVSSLNVSNLPTAMRAQVDQELSILKAEAKQSGDMEGIIKASAGGKDVDSTFMTSFDKGANVIYQIQDLQQIFLDDSKQGEYSKQQEETTGYDLNPIWGKLRKFNPWDTSAAEISAQLQAIVPNLARGVYGEVGVLTDNDIKNYSQTLPTLNSTEEVRKAVLGMTVLSVQRSLENKLKTQAASGRDVSGFLQIYQEIKSTADSLLSFTSGNSESSENTDSDPLNILP